MGNSPLWSLSYEVFFYAVFPLVMIAWRRNAASTRWLVGLVACASYAVYLIAPNHFALVTAYFLIWWLGAMLAWAYLNGRLVFREFIPEVASGVVLCVLAVIGVVAYGQQGIGVFPVLMVRHFAIGLILLLLLVSPARRALAAASFGVRQPAAFLASISYGIYVLHYPIVIQTGSVGTWWLPVTLVATVGIALFADLGLARWLPKAPKS
jgi:peptidoglycan/LPS O-acetylase OafA/YrhL